MPRHLGSLLCHWVFLNRPSLVQQVASYELMFDECAPILRLLVDSWHWLAYAWVQTSRKRTGNDISSTTWVSTRPGRIYQFAVIADDLSKYGSLSFVFLPLLPVGVDASDIRKLEYWQFNISNQLVAGLIIVRHMKMKSTSVPSSPFTQYGPMRSTQRVKGVPQLGYVLFRW